MSPAAATRITLVVVRVVNATSGLLTRPVGEETTTCAK
jgi:hypothetical protein